MSLIPFTTSWIGDNHEDSLPVAAYGIVLLCCAMAYFILQNIIIKSHGDQFALKKVIGGDRKGKISPFLYILGILLSFVNIWLAISCYVAVAVLWFIPDSRIEKSM